MNLCILLIYFNLFDNNRYYNYELESASGTTSLLIAVRAQELVTFEFEACT